MNILIAEDEDSTREWMEAILKKWGYEPLLASNGKQALAAMQGPNPPKLVLLDWVMPEMEGIEVCRRLRELEITPNEHKYIILLTSLGGKKNIVEGFEAGADDYIVKPFDPDELKARIAVGKRMVSIQSEMSTSIEKLTYQAYYDSLTKTYNRSFIVEMLKREINKSERENTSLCVAMIDIDKFKVINDSHGHQVGDDVLVEITHRIKSNLRPYDLLGRLGGDEFLLLNRRGPSQDMLAFYNRICAFVASEQINTRAVKIPVTISIGATMLVENRSVDEVIAIADKALYQAKHQGRNRVVFI